ncbi:MULTISPECIES: STAS domain-containing protein [unclassified Nostoc]|uniref:slr1659 superfamily regulator n=1 Tax=unclassified Nostoc TaxID=2593658 RepID=UPI0025EDF67A|nr:MULTISPECIES: STAS domain-containing protein [unclassified Nostoc]
MASFANQMEIKDKGYSVHYDLEAQTVIFQGELLLSDMDSYAPIMSLLDNIVAQEPPVLTLDLRGLEFLNSSGINMLFRLVIKVREKENIQLVIRGASRVSWQSKSLVNLQRLMPTVQLNLE